MFSIASAAGPAGRHGAAAHARRAAHRAHPNHLAQRVHGVRRIHLADLADLADLARKATRAASAALMVLLALAGCGGGEGPAADDDARVADARLPLRYEVTGLQGSGGYVMVAVSPPGGMGEVMRIPLNANGSFRTDTDPFVEHSHFPDGLYPSDATYRVINQDSWAPSNPTQACSHANGPLSQGAASPPQPIGNLLRIDCSAKPLRYEVRGLKGAGATVYLMLSSATIGSYLGVDLHLRADGTFSSDTDDQPGPRFNEVGSQDGLLPADTFVRALEMDQPTGPDQACTVNGNLLSRQVTPLASISDTVVIDCTTQPLHYEVRGLQGSGANLVVVFVSLTAGLIEYDLRLSANGHFTTDTDSLPGPQYLARDDPVIGSAPGFEDGRFPADTLVRTWTMTQPAGPAQLCTVNGTLPGERLQPGRPVSEPLVIDCASVYKQWRFDTADTIHLPNPPGSDSHGNAFADEVARTYAHPRLGSWPMGADLFFAPYELFDGLLDKASTDAGMYSSADGRTYWIATEAPLIGPKTIATIETRWGVRRSGDDPNFTLTLSALQLAGVMEEGLWFLVAPNFVRATATMEVRAHKVTTGPNGEDVVDPVPFHFREDRMELAGSQVVGGPKNWKLQRLVHLASGAPIFDEEKFVLMTSDGNGSTGNLGHGSLREPIALRVNLGLLKDGERALIVVRSQVDTHNRFNGESRAVAFLRDPATFDPGRPDQAVAVTEIAGLALFTPPALPGDFKPQADLSPAAACAVADAPRAVLQLGAAAYALHENDPDARVVTVTRTGSTQGEVSARLRLVPGSAQAGADYVAQEAVVRFGDGDASPRSVPVQVIDDPLVEGPEMLTVALDQPGGCADIGPQAAAAVTVLDDESLAPTQYTLGGTVTGLVGSGLVVESLSEALPIGANGAFQFARVFPAGYVYQVRVRTQPQNPRQACTVYNGEGTVTDANITQVQIACTTLAESGALDAGFGNGGRAWITTLMPRAQDTKLARQADGKLLVAGGTASLLRLQPDGTPDAGFGTAGNGLATLQGARNDEYNVTAVAVQPDGRIVVAGSARIGSSGRHDMLVARFLPDGTLDGGFAGGAGLARFDYALWNDGATQVLIQADGAILVVGSVSDAGGNGDPSDFAVLRLSASGQVDTGYGRNGWARMNVAGGYDVPRAAVLTPDGGVVLAGRVAPSGGSNADIGLVKFTAAGQPDTGFGTAGTGIVRPTTPEHDEARDIAVMADGRLLVVGERSLSRTGGPYGLWLTRYLANGQPDTGFGSGGVATLATLLSGYAVTVQSDGVVWVAGAASSTSGSAGDFGLARFAATGQPDGGFGTDGLLAIDLFGGSDIAGAMLWQPDGLLVLAGPAYNGSTLGLGLVRVMP